MDTLNGQYPVITPMQVIQVVWLCGTSTIIYGMIGLAGKNIPGYASTKIGRRGLPAVCRAAAVP